MVQQQAHKKLQFHKIKWGICYGRSTTLIYWYDGKNESRCLEKCLNALTPLRNAVSCELVIADTGSTDNTKEIAAKYADTLFDFPWVNDFSKARNAVMDHCKGKWFITIDADEYLESSPDELVAHLIENL